MEILARRRQRREDAVAIAPVISRAELLAMQASLEDVHVAPVVERYIVDVVQATRADHRVALGASPRGTLALLKLARARAALERRDFVLPDDVKAMAIPALAHRLVLKPELWAARVSAVQVVDGLPAQVPRAGPPNARMTARVTPLGVSLMTAAGVALSLGVLTGRPELFVAALPLLLALVPLALRDRPSITGSRTSSRGIGCSRASPSP